MSTTSIKKLVCLWTLDEMRTVTKRQLFFSDKRVNLKNPKMLTTFKKFQNIFNFTDRTKEKIQMNSQSAILTVK